MFNVKALSIGNSLEKIQGKYQLSPSSSIIYKDVRVPSLLLRLNLHKSNFSFSFFCTLQKAGSEMKDDDVTSDSGFFTTTAFKFEDEKC